VYDLGLLSRILTTPEFKLNDGHRTELKAKLILWTMLVDFDV
jgi:hypothetical protein